MVDRSGPASPRHLHAANTGQAAEERPLRDCSSLPPADPNQPHQLQVVSTALRYFERHGCDALAINEMADALGVSENDLEASFDQVRGMTPAQALLEHRLNRLFHTLTDHPRQGLRCAIQACGLARTRDVVALFEQTFGIEMALFLLTSRRAAEDRLFRRLHPEAEALVLPS